MSASGRQTPRHLAIAALATAFVSTPAYPGDREALMGPQPWNFPDRKRETNLALEEAKKAVEDGLLGNGLVGGGGLGAAGLAAGGLGSPIIINSTAYAIGNWQQIEMTLGDGAEGLIMTESHQTSSGSATATSTAMQDQAAPKPEDWSWREQQ